MTRAVVLDANLVVLLVAGQTDAHLADIPQFGQEPHRADQRHAMDRRRVAGLAGDEAAVDHASSRRVSAHSRIIRCPAKRLEILNHTVREATPTMCRDDGR